MLSVGAEQIARDDSVLNGSRDDLLAWLGKWNPATDSILDLAQGPGGSGRAFEAVRAAIAAGRFLIDAERLPESCEGLSAAELLERARRLGIPDLAALVERGPRRGAYAVRQALPHGGPVARDRAWALMSRWAIFHARRPYVEHVMPTLLAGYEELRGAGVTGSTLQCWLAGVHSLEMIFGDEHRDLRAVETLLGVPAGWFGRFLRHYVQFAITSFATELAPDPADVAATLLRLGARFADDGGPELAHVLQLATIRLMLRAPATQVDARTWLVEASVSGLESEALRGAWLGAVRRDIETNMRLLEDLGRLFAELSQRGGPAVMVWDALQAEVRARKARFQSAPLGSGSAASDGTAGAFAELLRARVGFREAHRATAPLRMLRAWNTLTFGVGEPSDTYIDEHLRSVHVEDVWIAFADVARHPETGELIVLVETTTLDDAIAPKPEDAWARSV